MLGSGHYANVLRLDDVNGLALSTDGVGSKVIVAEQLGRFDTVGIDCIAMNVNDLICVGAEPIALVDYIAVEQADPEMLRQVAEGLKAGAEQAGIEIPGGELAQLPEVIRGHPSPTGFDLVGACVGLVKLDEVVTGQPDRARRRDRRRAVERAPLERVHARARARCRTSTSRSASGSVGDALIEPTRIYVREVLELLRSEVDVRGLAHITGDGFLNLGRLEAAVGYRISDPLPPQPIFEPDRRAQRTRRRRRCTRSSTWAAASAASCPRADAERAAGALGGQRDRRGDRPRRASSR